MTCPTKIVFDCLTSIPNKDVLLLGGEKNAKLARGTIERRNKKLASLRLANETIRLKNLHRFSPSLKHSAVKILRKKKTKLATWISNDNKTSHQMGYIITRPIWRTASEVAWTRTENIFLNCDQRSLISPIKLKLPIRTKNLNVRRYIVSTLMTDKIALWYQEGCKIFSTATSSFALSKIFGNNSRNQYTN